MKTRDELQAKLESIIGNKGKVYFQPPSQMSYPCILYDLNRFESDKASNARYNIIHRYNITYISKTGTDEDIINGILDIPYCSFDRRYIADNLYHDVFSLYMYNLKENEED